MINVYLRADNVLKTASTARCLMGSRRKALGWLLLISYAAVTKAASAQTIPEAQPAPVIQQSFIPARVPLNELPSSLRECVRVVLEHPTLSSRGPLEAFRCRPRLYYWLLDHPDVAANLWRGLGAKCIDISASDDGCFSWNNMQIGEVHWQTILRHDEQRVWYVEGRVKAGPMMPSLSFHAVLVLNHQEGSDSEGNPAVRHQMDLFLHTDSRTVGLTARLLGASVPRLADEYVSQLEMFFGDLAWYLSMHPDKAIALFQQLKASSIVPPSSVRSR
jgi:hypothetical protein